MLNRVIIAGRLTRDPELRTTTTAGVPVVGFSVAVDRDFKAADGTRETDYIDCVAWRKLAETVAHNLTKGRLVNVEGRLQIRQYEAKDGTQRRVAELVADNVYFMDKKPEAADKAPEGSDLPF